MKRAMIGLVLAVAMLLALSVPAYAETPEQGGFYIVDSVPGITIKGVAADKSAITETYVKPSDAFVPDADQYREFYPGAVQLEVTLGNTDSDLQYLVILSVGDTITESSLKYIDQAGNGSSLAFYVYPTEFTENTQLTLWITNSSKEEPIKIRLGYWIETSYEEQPYVLGDVDEDTYITSGDASFILQYLVDLKTLGNNAALAANVDGDEAISAGDASYILQYLASAEYANFEEFLSAKLQH